MSVDLALNKDNDLNFDTKNYLMEGYSKVRQQVLVRLRLFLGEYYDKTIGIPYFQSILGNKNPDLQQIFIQICSEIEKIEYVTLCQITDFDFENYALSISISVSTTFGVVNINDLPLAV